MSNDALSPQNGFRRIVRRLRGTRSGGTDDLLANLDPSLADNDHAVLRSKIDEAIRATTPPETARARVAEIGAAYLTLNDAGKGRFYDLLTSHYGVDEDRVSAAIARRQVSSTDDVVLAEIDAELRSALEPSRIRLLRYFSGLDSGVKFLVDLRSDVRRLRGTSAGRRILDTELRDLLASWFDVGLLRLERVTWSTSAAVLERLIHYEAVHHIASWDDLKRRLAPDRRLYAFFHPGMPDEPLIFVEVALTVGIADAIEPLIDPSAVVIDTAEADTAIFYSISNCQTGLAGVPLGDFLIKRVVSELQHDLTNIAVFSTLSPMPGFHEWVDDQIESNKLRSDEAEIISTIATTPDWWRQPNLVAEVRPALIGLAARYLLSERSNGRVIDPVARFHLSNGARVERLLFLANPTQVGHERGLAMMVNYRYVPRYLDENQEAYLNRTEVVSSPDVYALLEPTDRV